MKREARVQLAGLGGVLELLDGVRQPRKAAALAALQQRVDECGEHRVQESASSSNQPSRPTVQEHRRMIDCTSSTRNCAPELLWVFLWPREAEQKSETAAQHRQVGFN